MRCPYCGHMENKVVDSRISQVGDITRRRRECLQCAARFTTYERVEELMPQIVKKDGRCEEFDREKIRDGIKKACQKRPLTVTDIDDMTQEVESWAQHLGVKELSSHDIGERVMETLRKRDKVAYIRFASVYREFQDVDEFFAELSKAGGAPRNLET